MIGRSIGRAVEFLLGVFLGVNTDGPVDEQKGWLRRGQLVAYGLVTLMAVVVALSYIL